MTAKEMFEKLGFEQTLNDSDFIFYEKVEAESCHTRFMFALESRSFEAIFYVDGYGGGGYFIELDEFKVILKQMEELGWVEEEKQEIKQETNLEHYKDGIIELCIDELAISKGKVVECCAIPCSECDFEDKNGNCIGNHEIMKWLKQPYKKLPYKLIQWEYDLLNAYKNSGMRQCISNYGTLLEMYGKGHFKGIDTSTPIREILDNCKVV